MGDSWGLTRADSHLSGVGFPPDQGKTSNFSTRDS